MYSHTYERCISIGKIRICPKGSGEVRKTTDEHRYHRTAIKLYNAWTVLVQSSRQLGDAKTILC